MDLKKILPHNGPPINEVSKYIEKYKNDLIVIKYGGNVFIDRNIFNNFINDVSVLNKLGLSIVVIHGGGPRIKKELDKSNIQSKFIRGLRVTDKKIINIVESVLIDFNNDIVSSLKEKGTEAISIHTKNNNIIEVVPEAKELGFVGIPEKINNNIIKNILQQNKIPIISPLGLGTYPASLISKTLSLPKRSYIPRCVRIFFACAALPFVKINFFISNFSNSFLIILSSFMKEISIS